MKRIFAPFLAIALVLSALAVTVAPAAAMVDHPNDCWGTSAGYLILFDGDSYTGAGAVHCIPIIQGTRNDNSHQTNDGTIVDLDGFKNRAESGLLKLYTSAQSGYECGVTMFIYDGWGRTLDNWYGPIEVYAETPGWLQGDNGVPREAAFEINPNKDNENQSHTMGIGCYPAS